MATQYTFPGVYPEEFAPGAPIAGVSTSIAAFIGPAARGEQDSPTKITSWDQFLSVYGEHPLQGFFLWYAVRAFFENEGQVCYIVRASNGTYAETVLQDSAANPHDLIRVRARQPGIPAPQITVDIVRTHLLTGATTQVYRPQSTYTVTGSRDAQLASIAEAAQFRPGDSVSLSGIGDRQIARITSDTLRFTVDLNVALNTQGNIQLANLAIGATTVRIQAPLPAPAGSLVPGAMLTIQQGAQTTTQIVESVQSESLLTNPPITTQRVTFRHGVTFSVDLGPAAQPATVQSEEFQLSIVQGSTTAYDNLTTDTSHPRFFATVVNGDPSGLVTVELLDPPSPAPFPNNLPAAIAGQALGPAPNQILQPENLETLAAQDYIDSLDALRDIDDVNLIAIPDCLTLQPPDTPQAVQQAAILHCEQMGDRFAVLDAEANRELFGASSIEAQRVGLDSTRGYSALYYPWLRVRPSGTGAPILVPPSGHVCGIIARSDSKRGVHKAPANEIVNGALGVERNMSDITQGQLNIQGINVIRQFGGGRPTLWGARTTATDLNWQYVNIRRLFLFLEESIQEGIRWAVFEPNNISLWKKLNRSITDFLTRVWRDGALFGETPAQAFYVRIDEMLNTDSTRALGRLYIEIGVRPSYPAEFIIVRIGIWQGGSDVVEG